MSSRTRTGWEKARDAAWRAFGVKHRNLFIALDVGRAVAPALAVIVAGALILGGGWLGVGWLREHTSDDRRPTPVPTGPPPVEATAAQPDRGWNVLPGPGWLWAAIPAAFALLAFAVAYAHTPVPVWHRPGGVRTLTLTAAGATLAGVLLFLAGGR